MMLAEKLEIAVHAEAVTEIETPELAEEFNVCAAPWLGRRKIHRDFFTNQGPRFRPFFMRTLRHRRAGIGRSAYPGLKGDR